MLQVPSGIRKQGWPASPGHDRRPPQARVSPTSESRKSLMTTKEPHPQNLPCEAGGDALARAAGAADAGGPRARPVSPEPWPPSRLEDEPPTPDAAAIPRWAFLRLGAALRSEAVDADPSVSYLDVDMDDDSKDRGGSFFDPAAADLRDSSEDVYMSNSQLTLPSTSSLQRIGSVESIRSTASLVYSQSECSSVADFDYVSVPPPPPPACG